MGCGSVLGPRGLWVHAMQEQDTSLSPLCSASDRVADLQ